MGKQNSEPCALVIMTYLLTVLATNSHRLGHGNAGV